MYRELGERLSPASRLATVVVATLKTQEAIWLCAILSLRIRLPRFRHLFNHPHALTGGYLSHLLEG